MAKLTLNDYASLVGLPAAVTANNALVEAALENTLSRDGTTPNTMSASLDMNANRIINLPAPVADTEPARKSDLDALEAAVAQAALDTAVTNAQTAETAAEAAQTAAETAWDSFDDRYLGSKASDPTLDNDGNALLTGALYWDTANSKLKVYDGSAWQFAALASADFLVAANNLSDLASTSAARTALELYADTQARADVTAAATTDIGAATTQYIRITGANLTITSLGTAAAGTLRDVVFNGAYTLTHNATSLILPGGVSFDSGTGDTALFRSEGSGNWRCVRYQKASGVSVVVEDQVTTATILGATAGATVGEVGSYALFVIPSYATAENPGVTVAGSFLRYTATSGNGAGGTPSGTWRLMGQLFAVADNKDSTSLWLRTA